MWDIQNAYLESKHCVRFSKVQIGSEILFGNYFSSSSLIFYLSFPFFFPLNPKPYTPQHRKMTIEEGGTAISTTKGFHSSQSLSQRPFRIRKSLKELVHKQRSIPKSSSLKSNSKEHLTLPPLPHHDTKCDEFAYDVLHECQRG